MFPFFFPSFYPCFILLILPSFILSLCRPKCPALLISAVFRNTPNVSSLHLYCVGWGEAVHLVRRPLVGLLYQLRTVEEYGAVEEWELAGETKILGEYLPQWHFVHHKSQMTLPGTNPSRCDWKQATDGLSYGAACQHLRLVGLKW
jgi:hypothetical protein